MSAWTLGQIAKVEKPTPTASEMRRLPDGSVEVTFHYRLAGVNSNRATTVAQVFTIEPRSQEIDCTVHCDWTMIGTSQTDNPMLRVAFDTAFEHPTATYQVPFGCITRETNGQEWPALEWGDMGDGTCGVSVLNDSKYGYSADGSTMRMSLIRSSFDPDPDPNPGPQTWRYAIRPHAGGWAVAGIDQAAADFNQPMSELMVPGDTRGPLPLAWGALSISNATIVPTVLKRAEDDGDLVVRFYQSSGAATRAAVETNYPISGAEWVNFVEDALGKADVSEHTIPLDLHPWQIGTLKIKRAKE